MRHWGTMYRAPTGEAVISYRSALSNAFIGCMNAVGPETMWVSAGTGVESTGVRCVSAGAWYAAGFTMAGDFAGAAAACAFCFAPAPTTWQAIPFTSVSFGAKTLADADRSRHSILTAAAVCC